MKAIVFYDTVIKKIKPASNTFRVSDLTKDPFLKGFCLQVLPSGRKSYVLAFTSPETGKRKFLPLGNVPAIVNEIEITGISLSNARKAARAARGIINDGICPIEQQKREAQKLIDQEIIINKQGSVSQLFEFYIEDLKKDKKVSAKQVQSIFDRDIEPEIGNLKANIITSDHIADIIAIISDRGAPTLANRTRSYLRSAFKFGKTCKNSPRWRRNKDLPEFNIGINPVLETEKAENGDNVGNRNLSETEVNTLWNTIGVEAMSVDLSLALKFIISTGQRVEEVLEAPWAEFDLEKSLWIIPSIRRKNHDRNKSKEPHIVPLTKFHLQLLDEIQLFSGTSSFLFPQDDGKKPKTSGALRQAVSRFNTPQGKSKRKPFTKFSPRDLRRTWKTLAGSIGLSIEIRNRIQGHAFSDIGSKSYDRYTYLDEKKKGMQIWTDWLSATVEPKDK